MRPFIVALLYAFTKWGPKGKGSEWGCKKQAAKLRMSKDNYPKGS